VGAPLQLRIRRDDTEINVEFHLSEGTENFYDVVEVPHAGEKERHIRDGLLHGVTSAIAAR
jgi:hypothetical protein